MVNHIDIAPNFAGTLFGITNALSTIPSWVAPMTVGALTNGRVRREEIRERQYWPACNNFPLLEPTLISVNLFIAPQEPQ